MAKKRRARAEGSRSGPGGTSEQAKRSTGPEEKFWPGQYVRVCVRKGFERCMRESAPVAGFEIASVVAARPSGLVLRMNRPQLVGPEHHIHVEARVPWRVVATGSVTPMDKSSINLGRVVAVAFRRAKGDPEWERRLRLCVWGKVLIEKTRGSGTYAPLNDLDETERAILAGLAGIENVNPDHVRWALLHEAHYSGIVYPFAPKLADPTFTPRWDERGDERGGWNRALDEQSLDLWTMRRNARDKTPGRRARSKYAATGRPARSKYAVTFDVLQSLGEAPHSVEAMRKGVAKGLPLARVLLAAQGIPTSA